MVSITEQKVREVLDQQRWDHFEKDLQNLINIHSIDNSLNMADFVIAEHITANLKSLQRANTHQASLRGDSDALTTSVSNS